MVPNRPLTALIHLYRSFTTCHANEAGSFVRQTFESFSSPNRSRAPVFLFNDFSQNSLPIVGWREISGISIFTPFFSWRNGVQVRPWETWSFVAAQRPDVQGLLAVLLQAPELLQSWQQQQLRLHTYDCHQLSSVRGQGVLLWIILMQKVYKAANWTKVGKSASWQHPVLGFWPCKTSTLGFLGLGSWKAF